MPTGKQCCHEQCATLLYQTLHVNSLNVHLEAQVVHQGRSHPASSIYKNPLLLTSRHQVQAGCAAAAVGDPRGDIALAATSLEMPWRTSRPCRARSTNNAVSADVQYEKWLLMALSHGFSVGPVCDTRNRPSEHLLSADLILPSLATPAF